MNPAYFPVLLAKWDPSPDTPRRGAARLSRHLADVTEVSEQIVHDWGGAALYSVGLSEGIWMPRLAQALPRAAFLHDLGKANDHFQRMIRRPGAVIQAFRHEVISLWAALSLPDFRQWLCAGCDELTEFAILAAAGGHHLKLAGTLDLEPRPGSQSLELWFLGTHPDLAATLDWTATRLRLESPPRLPDSTIRVTARNPLQKVSDWLIDSDEWWRNQNRDARVFVGLVKALVIGADVAGSVVPRAASATCREWAHDTLHNVCTTTELERAISARLRVSPPGADAVPIDHALRPFQQAVRDKTDRVTFVRAGCGSGKTVAAYAWAARHAQGRKLFFTYPTTGTATTGFVDYVADVADLHSVLVHSRASLDLADLLENREEKDRGELASLTADRLAGLESWRAQVTVSTVDAVLGLIQNRRRGLFSSPALINGAFVFDEIHQYDDELFDALLHFLNVFRGCPTLLMTASLQASRLGRLRATLANLGEQMAIVSGPPDLEAYKRYRLMGADESSACEAAHEALRKGQKVLWVSNRVRRCQAVGARFGQPPTVQLYHSRYRYVDRVKRHRSVVEGFKADEPLLAATTQVCEVSLDLSADLLITDLASVPALIQRLGRLNRTHPERGAKPALVLPIVDSQAAPYIAAELALARHWLAELGEEPVSQRELDSAFESLAPPDPMRPTRSSAWIEGGITSAPARLREDGTTIAVLLQEDSGDRSPEAILRHAIPMPYGPVVKELNQWQRAGAALIAPPGRIQYDPLMGGAWT